MNNTIFMLFTIVGFLACALVIFALFAIGFLIGYRQEDRRLARHKNKKKAVESDEEKKLKKEWKKFLEYDGSAPQNYQ